MPSHSRWMKKTKHYQEPLKPIATAMSVGVPSNWSYGSIVDYHPEGWRYGPAEIKDYHPSCWRYCGSIPANDNLKPELLEKAGLSSLERRALAQGCDYHPPYWHYGAIKDYYPSNWYYGPYDQYAPYWMSAMTTRAILTTETVEASFKRRQCRALVIAHGVESCNNIYV